MARWQTDRVSELLVEAGAAPGVEAVIVETTGDARQNVPIHEIGGQGVFVKEVQQAVLDGRADFAVHSAKDLPSETSPGLVLAALPERADPRDALVGSTLQDLRHGARVATGSVRRRALLSNIRPDLEFAELRGNIGTRLRKAKAFDAIVVAAAALDRLEETPEVVERLDASVMIPQVAQGALAIECRSDDSETLAALASIDAADVRRVVEAERAFLAELGSGCDLPVGAHATLDGYEISIQGFVASMGGLNFQRGACQGLDGPVLAARLAQSLK